MTPRAIDEEDKIRADEARQVLRRTWTLIRPYRRRALVAAGLMIFSTAAVLAGPALVRYGIDKGVRAHDGGALNLAAAAYLVVAVAGSMLTRAQMLQVNLIGENVLRDLRIKVFDHIQSLSLSFFDREQTGRLVARMTSDIDSLQELVQMGLIMFMVNLLLIVASIAVLFAMSPPLAALSLLALIPAVVASIWFRKASDRAYLDVRDSVAATLSGFQEAMAGVRVVQAFAQEPARRQRFRRQNDAQRDANLHSAAVNVRYFPVVELSGVMATALVIGAGGWLFHRGTVTIGVLAAFVLYMANLFEPIQQLSQVFNTLQSAGAALHKLFGLLDTKSPVVEAASPVTLPRQGELLVEGVTFGYDVGRPVLNNVDLVVHEGDRIALVGPTGAGKSTLAKLMARLYDPTSGHITYGGVELRDASLAQLRRRIVVVPQEGYLFQGTVLDNIRIGRRDATDAEIRAAVRALGLTTRFEALPEGLLTEVRERGSRLSAGERQLVSLCRAALADPAVLVLDEATSSLDPGTEAEVEVALEKLFAGRTVVVIAHRLSTAERADKVVVVDAGGIVEEGPHSALVRAGGRYSSLWASWIDTKGPATTPTAGS